MKGIITVEKSNLLEKTFRSTQNPTHSRLKYKAGGKEEKRCSWAYKHDLAQESQRYWSQQHEQ